ncbi:MAG: pseudouridine synthase [Bacillota bacterium]|jgi:pseudouridine synthase
MAPERLQNVLSGAGLASRRRAAAIIREGRVAVNGITVSEPGYRVEGGDVVTLDGEPVGARENTIYLLLHKPVGYVSTVRDPQGRKTVMDLVFGVSQRVYPVGRLDLDSSGLILMTNDGDLAASLAHPRYQVSKTYRVRVIGVPSSRALACLREGVSLEDGVTAPAEIRLAGRWAKGAEMEFVLREGKKRQVRRMCQAVGHPVSALCRTALGPLELGDLAPGAWRPLGPAEIRALKQAPRRWRSERGPGGRGHAR